MPLSYTQSASLMNDMTFKGRVKVACLHFASYIFAEATDTPAHTSRVKWATNCVANPDAASNQISPPTVMQDQVQTAGADVTDVDLQTAVETVINSVL